MATKTKQTRSAKTAPTKTPPPFTPDMRRELGSAMQQVWSEIAGDVYAMIEEDGGRVTVADVREMVADADRIQTMARPSPALLVWLPFIYRDDATRKTFDAVLAEQFPGKKNARC